MYSIKDRYLKLIDDIDKSAKKYARNDPIKLLCVSKTFDVDKIKEVYDLGQRDFGENYIGEALIKIEKLPQDINWHFIGHLQSNKVKIIKNKFKLIHSLDSITTAKLITEKIDYQSGLTQAMLVQINIGDEETKHGISKSNLAGFLEEVKNFNRIKVNGLMILPPYLDDPEKSRPFFRQTAELLKMFQDRGLISGKELSMGMSHDFHIAISEGATIIRIGTRIFGERE